jgi:cell division protein FtsI (penicillin-binding protein 3)
VAGKTGTAYKLDPQTKRYAKDKYLSSFMGFVPADDPRLVILVLIDEPSAGKHYGGAVAGPVFQSIATESLRYLGIAATEPLNAAEELPDSAEAESEPDIEILADESGDDQPADDEMAVIPDFTGLSVGQAVALARMRGLRLEIEGTGSAIKQFPAPGPALKSIACHVTFDPG